MHIIVEWLVWLAFPVCFFGAAWKMGHSRFMNAFRRVAALWLISLGSVAVVGTAAGTIFPDLVADEPITLPYLLTMIVAFGLVIVLGVRWLRAPTYRPDLGDTMRIMSTKPWLEEVARRQGRNWWTGDPRPRTTKPPGGAI